MSFYILFLIVLLTFKNSSSRTIAASINGIPVETNTRVEPKSNKFQIAVGVVVPQVHVYICEGLAKPIHLYCRYTKQDYNAE